MASFIENIDSYRFGGKSLDEKTRKELISKTEAFITGLKNTKEKSKVTMTGVVLLLLTGFAFYTNAAPVDNWFEKANRFYDGQQFDSAMYYYEKIVESGINNSTVYYNLGNTCYRLKKIGMARLYYEKAARLSPGDQDIMSNIRFVNSNIVDRVPDPERGFLKLCYGRCISDASQDTTVAFILGITCDIYPCISSFLSFRNARLWLIYLSVLLAIFLEQRAVCGL